MPRPRAATLLLGVVACVLAATSAPASADLIPRPSLARMCLHADAIVEARVDGPRHVTVTRVFLAGPAAVSEGEQLEVPELAGLSMQPALSAGASPIEPTAVVLFLDTGPLGGWRVIGRSDQEGSAGAAGVYWLEGDVVSGYYQVMNPGPLALSRGSADLPATRAELATRIGEGLAQRRRWLEVVELPTKKRAPLVLAYTLPRTAPRGFRADMLDHRDLRRALVGLGPALVPAAIRFLDGAGPTDDVGTVVVALMDLGPPAAAAAPALERLRARTTATPLAWIDAALAAVHR